MAQIKKGRWVTQSGQGVSSAIELVTETLVGFYTPSALDAAQLKLQASQDGQAFFDVVDGGSPVAVGADTEAYIPLDASKLLGAAHVRIAHLDAGGGAVNESASREFSAIFRSFE